MNRGGGNNYHGGGGYGGNVNEIELGARRKTTSGPTLLRPLYNNNANYTPIQHRNNNGGQYRGGFNNNAFNNTNGFRGGYGGAAGGGRDDQRYQNQQQQQHWNNRQNGNDSGYTDWNEQGASTGYGLENSLAGDKDRPDGAAAMYGNGSPDGPMRPRLGSKRTRDGREMDSPPRTRQRH
jgi:hypothetical protein